MAKPTRVMCPFCKTEVAWFYGTQTFARHRSAYRPNQWCAAGNYRGTTKGGVFNPSDPRFGNLVMKSASALEAEPGAKR